MKTMTQPPASNTILFVSLFALTAASAVTGATLVSWSGGISERLNSQMDVSEDIPDSTIIGGVDSQEVYAYQVSAPPVIPYRAPNEALPSQRADPLAATTDDNGLLIRLIETPAEDTSASEAPASDVAIADTSSADALKTQANILDTMRHSADASF